MERVDLNWFSIGISCCFLGMLSFFLGLSVRCRGSLAATLSSPRTTLGHYFLSFLVNFDLSQILYLLYHQFFNNFHHLSHHSLHFWDGMWQSGLSFYSNFQGSPLALYFLHFYFALNSGVFVDHQLVDL